jgi:hypothetical protein
MVIPGFWCPSNLITAGKLTPARSISVPKECRNWCGTIRVVIPNGGNEISPEIAELADERVAAAGAG